MHDRKFRKPRIWSNIELKKFSHLFSGKVVNVSAWQDSDKQGGKYRDYFKNASEYWITNYVNEARGYQGGVENEIFLDLQSDIPKEYEQKFDAVFNHTVLEHIYEVRKAFSSLCSLSSKFVIIVIPFLQEQHAEYGDYWRFTPLVVKKMFEENGYSMAYINYNDKRNESVYIFAIGARNQYKIPDILTDDINNKINSLESDMLGTKTIRNSIFYYISQTKNWLKRKLGSQL